MANPYFANAGDVLKHLLLAALLQSEAPTEYMETHAGSLDYSLAHHDPGPGGVWDFLEAIGDHDTLRTSTYARLLRANAGTPEEPGRYPGSLRLAFEILGPSAKYVACDLDEESCRSLVDGLRQAGAAHSHVLQRDGLAVLADHANATGIVFIDPFKVTESSPQTGTTAWQAFAELAAQERRGVLWYAVMVPGQRLLWPDGVIAQGTTSIWRAELRWRSTKSGLAGCGVLATGLDRETERQLESLATALGEVLADDLPGLRVATGRRDRRGVGSPWHPHGAEHARPAEVHALLDSLGSPIEILQGDGSPGYPPVPKEEIQVHTDETGLVRLVIDDSPGGRPVTVRVGWVRPPNLQTDEGETLLLAEVEPQD